MRWLCITGITGNTEGKANSKVGLLTVNMNVQLQVVLRVVVDSHFIHRR